MFEFKIKKGKYIWADNYIKLVFSNPKFQAFSDYIRVPYLEELEEKKEEEIVNNNSIMYYYYDVSIYIKKRKKWKKVCARSTYDFPSLLELRAILKELVPLKDASETGEKLTYQSGNISYAKRYYTEGFGCDDFYDITKIIDDKTKKSSYIVYLGTTFDIQGDLNSVGVRTPYATNKDMKKLLECVESFIRYSIDIHNEQVRLYVAANSGNKEISNKLLIEYQTDDSDSIILDQIDALYTIGDKLSSLNVVESVDIHKSYEYSTIKDICDDHIVIVQYEKEYSIPIKNIIYLSNEVDKEKLSYNVQEVADEFYSVLGESELSEFSSKSIDELKYKYKSAIINRTWMCREEHGFNKIKSGYPSEDIDYAVVNVIEIIKSKLKK